MMVAAAAAISLVGLSANMCGSGDKAPEPVPPAEQPAQPDQPPAQ